MFIFWMRFCPKKISLPKIKIDVFIMAGGIGKRLRPLTEILPKPLFPVNGKPIIQKIIHDFDKYNIKNFFISINYKSKILKAYLSDLKQNKKNQLYLRKNTLRHSWLFKKSIR